MKIYAFLFIFLVFSFFSLGKPMEWQCKNFTKIRQPFWKYGVCAYSIRTIEGKKNLVIRMPLKKDFKKLVLLSLPLLDKGNSYTDEKGQGHWKWNKNPNKITLYGSIGTNQVGTIHSWLRDGKLILID